MNNNRDLALFKEYLSSRASRETVRVYMHSIRHVIGNVETLNQPSIQAYIDKMLISGKSPNTVSTRAYAILRFMKWKNSPIELDFPPVRIGAPKYLTQVQVNELLDVCENLAETTLITVLFDTAVRISELLELRYEDINTKNSTIAVHRKGGELDVVNVGDRAMSTLIQWVNGNNKGKVFPGINYHTALNIIKNVGDRIDLHITPHIFRHSRAIQMLENGAEINIVMQHLGHKNINTTIMIYGRFKAQDLKDKIPSW